MSAKKRITIPQNADDVDDMKLERAALLLKQMISDLDDREQTDPDFAGTEGWRHGLFGQDD